MALGVGQEGVCREPRLEDWRKTRWYALTRPSWCAEADELKLERRHPHLKVS